MEQCYKREMEAGVDAMLSRNSLSNKTVLLFGHCNATEETADYLLAHKVPVRAILDNNEAKQSLVYRDIPVKPPVYIEGFSKSDSIVLIAARFYEQMAAQLRRLGYNGDITKLVEYHSFAEYSLSDEVFARKKARVSLGMDIRNAIRLEYPTHHLVVCPHNALGDVYWAFSFLDAYRTKNAIDDIAVIVKGEGCRQIAGLFDIPNVKALDKTDMDAFVQALIFTSEPNCIIAQHDFLYTDNIVLYLNKHFLSFIDYYKYAIYALDQAAMPIHPSGHAPYAGAVPIKNGKTVILSPYAKSVVQPPPGFWEKLIQDYHQQGFMICCNVAGDEQPLAGTAPISVPLNQIVSLVEAAGHFIGLRSGLCDIVHTANCRKTVVFPDCIYSTTPFKVADFFALPGWKQIVF